MTHAALAAGCLAFATHARAQQPPSAAPATTTEPAAAAKEGKVLQAFRVASDPPRIDGRLDDHVWEQAASTEGLVQWEPNNMAPLSERTAVQVAYDDRNLYVAIRCDDRQPEAVTGPLARRDELRDIPTDLIGVGFDPRHDHLTGYVFMTNPAGVQMDFTFFNDESIDRDYDAVWEVRTERTNQGWTAEFRIPFSQIRFGTSLTGETVWGFSVRREIHRKAESGEWTARPRGERGAVSRWGHLVFGDRLTPPRRIELLPYVMARREASTDLAASHVGGAGLDLRLGLGTASTLSATVNPDFGQVELDPAVLNLSVFETFFPEKRPFFLEDSRTFVPSFGLFQLFHSRRIGRQPNRFAPLIEGDIVERPDETSVLGAAKLTGKASGWTYGALTALTGREYALVEIAPQDAAGAPGRREQLLEPLTSYNVTRVQRDVFNSSSNVGGIATAVVREGDADAFTGGIDYTIRWNRNRDGWNGHWAVTRAPGTGGLKTDVGGVTNFNVSRKYWDFSTHVNHFGRNFRVTDIGFHRGRVNSNQWNGAFRLQQPDPGKVFRRAVVGTGAGQSWTDSRLVFGRFAYAGAFAQFLNFWGVEAVAIRGFRVMDDLDTRGGPPIVKPADLLGITCVNSDTRKSWQLSGCAEGSKDEVGGWSTRAGPTLRLQPSTRLHTSIGMNYTSARDSAQWIRNDDTDGDGVTDHLYGTLRRTVLDVTLRTTYALHRDLSLQLFLQPFVAVGDYSNTRRLARPRSYEFTPVALSSDPDFNTKSLRGNLVLRWEYIRGSTLFVVWNLSTADHSRPGVFSPWRDLRTSFGGDGTHVFMIKASYWLSR